jgi:alpha-1,3-rhamnosyl/mannosyltransferase
LGRFFQVPEAKVVIVPPALTVHFAPRPQPDVSNEFLTTEHLTGPFAVYVGNHKPHKNLERLLRAYQHTIAQTQTTLVIAGAKASYEDPYTLPYLSLVQALGLEERVRFVGQVDDEKLGVLYATARFLIFPSLYEGFGLPPLEAMSYGTPVACSATTSLPEVVGEAALLFDPLDEIQMADVMLRLDQSEALRTELATRGLHRARVFSWSASAQKWLAALARVVAAGRVSSPY